MRLAFTVTTALCINWITACTNVPLGYSRNSSQSGNVLRHHCFLLAERSRVQAEFCKQPWAATGPGCVATGVWQTYGKSSLVLDGWTIEIQPCCQNAGCLLAPACWASLFKHLWLLIAMGWMQGSARDAAGVLTPLFQSCVLDPLLPEGLSLLSVAAVMSAVKLLCFVWKMQ